MASRRTGFSRSGGLLSRGCSAQDRPRHDDAARVSTNTTNDGGVGIGYAYGTALSLANSLDAVRLISFDGFVSDTDQNSGDVAIQGHPDNVEIDRVYYKSAATSAQNGISRELKNPALDNTNMDGSNWADASVSTMYGRGGRGTPGAVNAAFTP